MKITQHSIETVVAFTALLGACWMPKKMLARGELGGRRRVLADLLRRREKKRVAFRGNAAKRRSRVKSATNRPDVGMLGTSRQLSTSCTQGFVDCVDGMAGGESCADACGGNCCVGDYACDGFTGSVCKDGSCNGEQACEGGTVEKIIDSCNYDFSCYGAGYYGTISSIIESCNAFYSCGLAGANGGIGDIVNSCKERNSCLRAGYYGIIGYIVDSCSEAEACSGLLEFGNLNRGITNSCNAEGACENLGQNETLTYGTIDCCNMVEECDDDSAFPTVCNAPSQSPTSAPTSSPTAPTQAPTQVPTQAPTAKPPTDTRRCPKHF